MPLFMDVHENLPGATATDVAQVVVHCTVTRQLINRPGYLEEFLRFWSAKPETRKIWISLYTPQKGEQSEEMLRPEDRARFLGLTPGDILVLDVPLLFEREIDRECDGVAVVSASAETKPTSATMSLAVIFFFLKLQVTRNRRFV